MGGRRVKRQKKLEKIAKVGSRGSLVNTSEAKEVMGITVRPDTEVRLEQERGMRKASEEKLRVAEERLLCVICQAQEVGSVFLPCGHFCCCTNCEDMIQMCPMC